MEAPIHTLAVASMHAHAHAGRQTGGGLACASRNASTMRRRAWIFCSARFSGGLPPCTLQQGHTPQPSHQLLHCTEETV